MKMKGFWKKIVAKVLTAVMIVSVFSTVDMGWNVMEVQAAGENFLTFTSKQDDSWIKFEYEPLNDFISSTVLYSVDGSNSWKESNGVKVTLNKGQTISYKSNRNTPGIRTTDKKHFSMGGRFDASGDVTSLLNGIGGDIDLTAISYYNKIFSHMFYMCTALETPPNLPSTKLAVQAYNEMFSGCTNLMVVPDLPATTREDMVYRRMFNQCTNIKVYDTPTLVGDMAYTKPFIIPNVSMTTGLDSIFMNTGGPITQITAGKTYYTYYPHTHSYSAATCQKPATCTLCNIMTTGSKANHSFTVQSGIQKSPATCTAAAEYYYKCKWCNLQGTTTYTSGSALGHEYTQYSTSDKAITVKCKRYNSGGCTQSVTYTLKPNNCTDVIEYINRENYTGAEVTTSPDTLPSGAPAIPKVMYQGKNRDGSNYGPTEAKPNDTGTYEAYIELGGQKVSSNFSIAPGGDIYKFNGGDGGTGTMSDQLVLESEWKDGETQLNPNEFSKTGYSFDKWESDSSNSDYQFFEDKAKVRRPNLTAPWTLTLTAQWKANDYTVTFDNNGADKSQGIQSETVTYDATIPSIADNLPEKNCSEFLGYFTDKTSENKIYQANGTPEIAQWTTPNNTTLYAHWDINHNWGYEAKDNQVIATCKDCGFSQKMTLEAPDSVYNKNVYDKASVTNEDEFPQEKDISNIEYQGITASGSAYVKKSTAPKDAGTYKATVTVTDDDEQNYVAEKSFTIEKAEQNATASVEDYIWGIDTLPTPEINGERESATPTYYYNTKNSNEGGKAWADLTPELLDAGIYYVYAELSETDNYKPGNTPASEFTITGKTFNSTRIKTTAYNKPYDKTPHTIGFSIDSDVDDPDEKLIITYSTEENGTYSETMPTFTDAGDYTVYYRVKKFGYKPAEGFETVKIAKKEITVTPTAGQSKSYGTPNPVITYDADPALCTGDKFTGGLTYTGTDVGNYPIEIGNLSAGNNYELNLTSGVTFGITKAEHTSGPAKNVGYIIDYVAETLAPQSTTDFEIGKKDGEEINAVATSPVALADELSSTPLREIYYVCYKANDNQYESPWTAITIPARPAAPNAVGKQETVMNKKDAEITGVNSTMEYRFDDDAEGTPWRVVTDNKISNPDNKNITIRVKASNTNKNFYGQEKNIEFTPSTTKLKVRIGEDIIEVPYGGTIPIDHKPQNPTPPNGQVFMHWAFGDKEWIFDDPDIGTDDEDASKVTDNITLVPVWGVEIHGIITAQDYDSITKVSLVDGKGNSYKHHDLEKQNDGTYKYSVIAPAGVNYNLVIKGTKKISEDSHEITKTQLVNLKQGGDNNVSMPAGVFNSKITKEDAGNYEHTLVGGLDNIADAHNGASDVVTVEMKVSANVSNDNKIKSAIKNKTLDFVELTLTKTTNSIEENIGSTNNQLLEIIIPYKISGKYSITVYRYHDEKVDTLTSARNKDGEYFKIGSDTITIYAKKFSTYAIGYSTKPLSSGPNDSDESQGDDSGTPSGSSLPKKDITAEKKQTDVLPRLIAKNTKQKDGDEKETNTGLLASGVSDNLKDNQEKSEDVKGDSVVNNDKTQLEEGAPLSEGEAHKGKHNLLWLYLLLIIIYTVTRVITKEKTKPVKLSLAVGNAVVAGLLLFVVKVCFLSIIVCLAEIVLALIIHFVMRKKATNE